MSGSITGTYIYCEGHAFSGRHEDAQVLVSVGISPEYLVLLGSICVSFKKAMYVYMK